MSRGLREHRRGKLVGAAIPQKAMGTWVRCGSGGGKRFHHNSTGLLKACPQAAVNREHHLRASSPTWDTCSAASWMDSLFAVVLQDHFWAIPLISATRHDTDAQSGLGLLVLLKGGRIISSL